MNYDNCISTNINKILKDQIHVDCNILYLWHANMAHSLDHIHTNFIPQSIMILWLITLKLSHINSFLFLMMFTDKKCSVFNIVKVQFHH